jgi:tetratricopeptide (TPR) repeat protein
MKRSISLWLGLAALALTPALAQVPAAMGKIHGHVTNPVGTPTTTGTVSLSNDGNRTNKYTFPVDSNGDYKGEGMPGTYTVIYRAPDTPADKMVDQIENVRLLTGQDILQDIDMSRKEFIDRLSPEEKKNLEEIKKKNAAALSANKVIQGLNADLRVVMQDIKDADAARIAAAAQLTGTPTKQELDAKAEEIRTAKFTEVETLMLKDTAAKPDASVLWAQLCKGQIGLKKYDEAETSCKKALDLEATSKKPNPQTQGAAGSDLGEVYARSGKVPEANAAYDAAAKINPPQAYLYLKNEAVIFSQVGNADAQAAAADEAIKADPTQPLPYYLKGQGLIGKATFKEVVDPKTHAKSQVIVLPDDCLAAYQKYLELAPTGTYSNDVKGILAQAGQKQDTSFKAAKTKK